MTKISIVQNSFGHLHIFKGVPKLNFNNRKNITKDYETESDIYGESEIYLQVDYEINDIKQQLSKRQLKDLDNGYRVVIDDIGYFC